MPIRAFLLCSDEKALDAVTQVFAELDISFEHFHDPSLAVRRLGVQRFDVILVDCDNVPNATSVFDTLRKSNLNQSSISIAIVDGKAGVPTAFRLGAGLVMTKPVSLEQAKGTLRNAIAMQRKETPETKAFAAAAARGNTAGGVPLEPHPGQRAGDTPATIVHRAVSPAPTAQSTPNATFSPEPPSAEVVPEVKTAGRGLDRPLNEAIPAPAFIPPTKKIKPAASNLAEDRPRAFQSEFVPAELRQGKGSGRPNKGASSHEPLSDLDDPDEFAGLAPLSAHTTPSAPSFAMIGSSRQQGQRKGPSPALLCVFAFLLLAAAGYWAWTSQPEFRSMALAQYDKAHFLITGTSSHPQSAAASVLAPSKTVTPPAPPAGATTSSSDTRDDNSSSAGNVPDGFAVQTNTPAQGFAEPAATSQTSSAPVLLATSGSKKDASNIVNVKISNPSEPILVPEDVSEQHLAYRVRANYPEGVHRKGLQGTVVLTASVNQDGTVDSVKAISGDAQLETAAIEAVQQWRYDPYFHNGKPTAFQTQVTIQFQPPQKKAR